MSLIQRYFLIVAMSIVAVGLMLLLSLQQLNALHSQFFAETRATAPALKASDSKHLKDHKKAQTLLISTALLMALMLLVMGFWFRRVIQAKNDKISMQLQLINSGQYAVQGLGKEEEEEEEEEEEGNDELNQIIKSLNHATRILRDMTQVAEDVSNGELTAKVEVKGEDDVLALSINKMLETMSRMAGQAEMLAQGNYEQHIQPNSKKDVLGIALKNMTQNLRDVSQVARNVSHGDFDVNVEVKSNDDLLALSMNKMVETLRSSKINTEQETWVNNGILGLNNMFIEEMSLKNTTQQAIRYICEYVVAFVGVLYIYDETKNTLNLNASYAFFPQSKDIRYPMGVGTVGEAAKNRKCIEHSNIQNTFSEDTNNVAHYAGIHTFTLPLVYQDQLFGVIEIASYQSFTDSKRQFLQLCEKTVATAIASALSQEEVVTLLASAQQEKADMSQRQNALDAHAIVGITDIKGNITYANEKFSEISGFSNAELVGNNHRLVNSGEYDKQFWHEMYKTIASGKVWHNPAIKNKRKDGTNYWVDTTVFPFMGSSGKPESYIAIRTDVTKNKKSEAELINAKDSAEQAVQAKSDFLATMSHEIRTPMNGVIGMLRLLTNSGLNPHQQHHAQLANASAVSLLSVINDILDFSKLEADMIELDNQPFDLRVELGNFSKSIAINLESKNVELLLDLSRIDNPIVSADMGRLKQVLNNLVGNAIKFTLQGSVVITANIEPQPLDIHQTQLLISVKDSGIGIEPDKIAGLFDAFIQADSSTTRQYGGTGLGLSIAKKLVGVMGGNLSVESIKNEGSTFSFSINVKVGESPALKTPVLVGNNKILVVDDNTLSLDLLKLQLGQWGMDVTTAQSAQQALDICQSLDYNGQPPIFNTAFIDMTMPHKNGEQLGKELMALPACQNCKLILMSDYGLHESLQELKDMGFANYFTKPTTAADLYGVLDNSSLENQKTDKTNESKTSKTLSQPPSSDTQKWPKNTRLLLVEDNHINQIVAEELLADLGLKVDIANNGQEALSKLNNNTNGYSLILMDCQMPIMDGYEASRQIRLGHGGEKNKNICIIAMTANAMEGDREKCLAAGMNDYESKPINPDSLKIKLEQWITPQ